MWHGMHNQYFVLYKMQSFMHLDYWIRIVTQRDMLKQENGPFYSEKLANNEIVPRIFQNCYLLFFNDIFKPSCHFALKSQGSILFLV